MVFSIGKIELSKAPESDEEISNLAVSIANELGQRLLTEQDVYWFVIEQYDIIQLYNSRARKMSQGIPISLCEIEHDGKKSENSYIGKQNPGITYLNDMVSPVLEGTYGRENAEIIRVLIFGIFCDGCKDSINRIRLYHAVHFHNNCVSNASWRFADKWKEVIIHLGGEYIS